MEEGVLVVVTVGFIVGGFWGGICGCGTVGVGRELVESVESFLGLPEDAVASRVALGGFDFLAFRRLDGGPDTLLGLSGVGCGQLYDYVVEVGLHGEDVVCGAGYPAVAEVVLVVNSAALGELVDIVDTDGEERLEATWEWFERDEF